MVRWGRFDGLASLHRVLVLPYASPRIYRWWLVMSDRKGLTAERCCGKVPGDSLAAELLSATSFEDPSAAIHVKGPGVDLVACSSMLPAGDCDMTLVVMDRQASQPPDDCLKQSFSIGLQSALGKCKGLHPVQQQPNMQLLPGVDVVSTSSIHTNCTTAAALHDSPSCCSCSRQPSFAQNLQYQQLSSWAVHQQQQLPGVDPQHQHFGGAIAVDAKVADQVVFTPDQNQNQNASLPSLNSTTGLKPILRIDIPSALPTSLHSIDSVSASSSVPVQQTHHARSPPVFSGFETLRGTNRGSHNTTAGHQQQQHALEAHDLAQRLMQLGFHRTSSGQLPGDSSSEDEADGDVDSSRRGSSRKLCWQGPSPIRLSQSQVTCYSDSSNIVSDRCGKGVGNSVRRTTSAAEQHRAAEQGTPWHQSQQSLCDQRLQQAPIPATSAGSVPASPYIGEKARAAALLSPCLAKSSLVVRRRAPACTPSRIILSPVAPDGSGDPEGQPKLFVSIPKQVSEEKRSCRPAGRSQTCRSVLATPRSGGARQMLQQLAGQDSLDKFTSAVTSPTAEAAAAAAAASQMSINVAAAAAQLLGKNRDAAAAAIASAIAGDTSPLLQSPVLTAPSSATNSTEVLPSPIAVTPRGLPLTPATPVHPIVAAVAAKAFKTAAEAVGEAAAAEVASGHMLVECDEGSGMDEALQGVEATEHGEDEDTSSEEWWCGSLTGMVVRELMTGPLRTVHQDADVVAARQLMVQHNLPGILVDTGTDVPGFLTRRDIFKASVTRRGHKKKHLKPFVRDIMSHPVIAVDASQPIELCAQLMQEHGIQWAAVRDAAAVDPSNPLAAYVGLVSDFSIFRYLGLYSEEGNVLEEEEQGLLALPSSLRLGSAVNSSVITPISSRAMTPLETVPCRSVPLHQQEADVGRQQQVGSLAQMDFAVSEGTEGSDAGYHLNALGVPDIFVVQQDSRLVGSIVSSAGSLEAASFGADVTGTASKAVGGQLDTAARHSGSSSSGRLGEYDALQRYRTAASLWQVDMDEVEMIRKIGEGSFGEVMLAKYRGTKVAVKRLRALDFDDHPSTVTGDRTGSQAAFQQFFEREIAILASIRHPNVVNFIGACHEPGQRCLVTEYCARGSLDQVLHKSGLNLDLQKRVEFAMDIARGMACLHAQRPIIIHRDLKTANLLVSARFEVKVADFGLSRIKDASHLQVSRTGLEGTIEYCAPEVLRGEPFTERCDVYSFGVVLWELLLRQRPYSDHEVPVYLLMVNIGSGVLKLPEVPADAATPGLCQMVSSCLSFSAADRPDFREVLHVLEDEYKALRASNVKVQQRQQMVPPSAPAAVPIQTQRGAGDAPLCSVQRVHSSSNSSDEQRTASDAEATASGTAAAGCDRGPVPYLQHPDPYHWHQQLWHQQQVPAAGFPHLQSNQQFVPQLQRHRLSQADSLGSSPGRAASILSSAPSAAGAGLQCGSGVDSLQQMMSAPPPQLITPQQYIHAASIPSSGCSSPRQQQQQGAVRVLSAFGAPTMYAPQQYYHGVGMSGGGVGGSCSKPPRQKQHLSRAKSMPVPQNMSWDIAEDEPDEDTDGTEGTGGADLLLFEDSCGSDIGSVHALRCMSAYGQCPPTGQLCMVLDPAASGNSGAPPQLPTGQLYLAHPQQQVLLATGQAVQAVQAVPVLITQPGYVQCQPVYQQQQPPMQHFEEARSQPLPQHSNATAYQQQPLSMHQSQGSQPLQVSAVQQAPRAVLRGVYSPSTAPTTGLSTPPLSSSPSMNLNPLAVMAAAGAAAAARREGAGSGPASPNAAAALTSSGSFSRSIHRRTSSQGGAGGQCPPVHLQFNEGIGTAGSEPRSSMDTACSTPVLGGAAPPAGITAPLLLQRLDSLHRSGSSSPRTCSGSFHLLPGPALHPEGSGQLIGVLLTAGSGPSSAVGSPVSTFLPVASHHRHTSSRLAIQGSHELPHGMLIATAGSPCNSFSGLTEQHHTQHQHYGNLGGATPGSAIFLHQAAPHLQSAGRKHSLLRHGSNLRDRSSSPWTSLDGEAALQQADHAGRSPFAAADVQSSDPATEVTSGGGAPPRLAAANAGSCNVQSPFGAVASSSTTSPFAAANADVSKPSCTASAGPEQAAGSTLSRSCGPSPPVVEPASGSCKSTSSTFATPFAAAAACSPFAVASAMAQLNESAESVDNNPDTEAVDDTTPRGGGKFSSGHDGVASNGDCKRRAAGTDGVVGGAAVRSDKAIVSPFALLQQAVTDDTVDGVQ